MFEIAGQGTDVVLANSVQKEKARRKEKKRVITCDIIVTLQLF